MSGIACAALMLWSAASSAELSVKELNEQPFGTRIAELFQLGEGDLFLRVTLRPLSVLYQLALDGQVKQRVDLPHASYQSIVPYRNGFVAQSLATDACIPRCSFGGSELSQIVAYERLTDTQPKVLYQSQPGFHTTRLVGAPDARDLYVMEVGMQGHQLTRIDSHGQVVWQKATEWIEPSSFVATDDGIAFAQYASRQDAALVVKALDRDGRMRWEVPLSFRTLQEALFSPAGFIALPTHAEGGRRLVLLDVRTGKLTADVVVQPFGYAVGTRDGLLLAGPMLGQSYVAMLGHDGKFLWLRRYVADRQVNDIQRAVVTREGKLVLISQERVPTTVTPITSVVVTDSSAASLGVARARCLDPKWNQSVELASQLQGRGLFVEPPRADEMTTNSESCSDRETQFIAFMQGLVAALPPAAHRDDPRHLITVRLTAAGEPLRLESYSADRSGYPSAGVTLSFASPHDRAAEFWKIVSTEVLPHLERMRVLDERFAQMTGFRYVVNQRNELRYGQTLTELETAARTVNERVGGISPEKLAEVRGTGPVGYVQILLRLDGFGAGDGSMYPVAAADRTFLAIAEQNRRAAEEGTIVIRD